MNIFTGVTLKTLAKNRVRTIVTVIGIILSAAMITAVTVSVSSFAVYLRDLMAAHEGLWHGAFYNMPASDRERLEADPRLDSAAYAQVMGWADTSGGGGGAIYYQVLGGDDTFFERMPIVLTQGRLPENPGEIVLRDRSYEDIKLGDTMTLELGDRYLDGELLDSFNWWADGEELKIRQTRTYTVVGFCQRPAFESGSLAGSMAFTRWDDGAECPYLECYWLLHRPKDTYEFQSEFPGGAYSSNDNSDYLMALGVSRYNTYYTVLYGFAGILIMLIMFGSVSLIYNAFSISVAERTRQFGLLRSVGATKKQLRSMVFTEALLVSALGLPLGILSGILGMGVTFRFIGKTLGDVLSQIVSVYQSPVVLRLRVSPLSIVSAVAIGLVTVLISAWVPSRRAMRVTAIEAIRQSGDVKVKRREVRISPLTYKLFGLEGAIASKHFKRDRKRYRATVVSLFMSVVLFISASSFCRYMTDTVKAVYDGYDYDISYDGFYDTWLSAEENEEYGNLSRDRMGYVASLLSKADNVIRWSAYAFLPAQGIHITRGMVPEETWDRYFGEDANASAVEDGQAEDTIYANLYVYGVEDECYREYLKAHGLPEEEYMGEDPKIIVRALNRHFNDDTQRVERLRLLREDIKTLEISVEDEQASEDYYVNVYSAMTAKEREEAVVPDFSVKHTYEIGAFSDDLPLGLNGQDSSGVAVLMPESELARIDLGRYQRWNMCFRVTDPENGLAGILSAAGNAGISLDGSRFYDVYADSALGRGIVTVVRVISYGFISLISAIAAVNVFNTVSTNILLRRREFAMLKSVGMTSRGFRRMMDFECLIYGAKSLLYGIPAAFAVTWLIFRAVKRGLDTDFYLPWTAVAAAVGSVFLVVFISMLYSMSGIKRDNPIDAMKNEVI